MSFEFSLLFFVHELLDARNLHIRKKFSIQPIYITIKIKIIFPINNKLRKYCLKCFTIVITNQTVITQNNAGFSSEIRINNASSYINFMFQ